MIRIWMTTLALVAVAIAALLSVPKGWMIYSRGLPSTPVVFIGTSLLAFGMPPSGSDLFGNDKPFERVTTGRMPEDLMVEFADLLVSEESTQIIVLEIFPLMRDFASDKVGVSQRTFLQEIFAELKSLSVELKTRLKSVISVLTGLQSSRGFIPEVSNTEGDQVVKRSDLLKRYPLHLRGPLNPNKLKEMIARAHQRRIDVYLIAPPLSQTAADYMGAGDLALLEQHVQNTAELIGLPLLYNGEVWPNSLFRDVGHLNSDGRARFMLELTRAWNIRHGN